MQGSLACHNLSKPISSLSKLQLYKYFSTWMKETHLKLNLQNVFTKSPGIQFLNNFRGPICQRRNFAFIAEDVRSFFTPGAS